MPSVNAKPGEHPENLVRRFKRACEKAQILPELKRRARFIKPSALKTQEKAAAIKRHLKKLAKEAPQPARGVRIVKKEKDKFFKNDKYKQDK